MIKNDRVAEINNVTGDGDSGNNSYIKRAVNGTSGMTGMVSRIIGMAVTDMSGENAGAQVDQNLTELDTVSRAIPVRQNPLKKPAVKHCVRQEKNSWQRLSLPGTKTERIAQNEKILDTDDQCMRHCGSIDRI